VLWMYRVTSMSLTSISLEEELAGARELLAAWTQQLGSALPEGPVRQQVEMALRDAEDRVGKVRVTTPMLCSIINLLY
jgi:hypothetical protein